MGMNRIGVSIIAPEEFPSVPSILDARLKY
jgi:hypothetical protein